VGDVDQAFFHHLLQRGGFGGKKTSARFGRTIRAAKPSSGRRSIGPRTGCAVNCGTISAGGGDTPCPEDVRACAAAPPAHRTVANNRWIAFHGATSFGGSKSRTFKGSGAVVNGDGVY
jgi:hypothetical protein